MIDNAENTNGNSRPTNGCGNPKRHTMLFFDRSRPRNSAATFV